MNRMSNIKNYGKFAIAFLFATVLIRLPLLGLPPVTDNSESRYASMAAEMVSNGSYWSPSVWIDGKLIPFMGKPPLGYWLIGWSIEMFGANEFAVRLPSLICSTLLLLMVYFILKRYSNEYIAGATTLIALSSTSFFILSGIVLIDMTLCLFSIGALFLYFAFLKEKNSRLKCIWSILVFLFLGLSTLVKGPVGLIYFGVPVFCWTLLGNHWKSLKHHAWFLGSVVFLLVTVPFFIQVEKSMPGFTEYFFYRENFLRFITKNYGDLYSGASHKVPHGVAIPMTLLVCLPWILLPLYNLFAMLKKSRKGVAVDTNEIKSDQPKWKKILIALHRTCLEPVSIFPVGVISLALFWSLSSHLMLYYLVLLVPLFAAWLAFYLHKRRVDFGTVAKIAVVMMALQLVAYFPVAKFADYKKSSKSAIAEAVRLMDESGGDSKIMFIRRVPYSAYFYAGNRIISHDEEAVEVSVEHGRKKQCRIFVSRTKYMKRPAMRAFIKNAKLTKFGAWTVIVPPTSTNRAE